MNFAKLGLKSTILSVYYPKAWIAKVASGNLYLDNGSEGIDKYADVFAEKTWSNVLGYDAYIIMPPDARVFYRSSSMKTPTELDNASKTRYQIYASGDEYGEITELYVVNDATIHLLYEETPSTTISSTDPNDIIKNISFDNEGNVTSITVDATNDTVIISDNGKVVTSNGYIISNITPSQDTTTIATTETTSDTTTSSATNENKVQALIDQIKSDPRGKHILFASIIIVIVYILYRNRERLLSLVKLDTYEL